MKIPLAPLMILLLFWIVFFSQTLAADQFSLGVSAYRQGDFSKALSHFKKCPDSPVKFYNLGNCYYKLDSLGWCILNYQKAKKIVGEEPDLMNNLQMANSRTRDKLDPPKTFFITLWLRHLILFFPAWFFPLFSILFSGLASLFFVLLFRSSDFSRKRRFFFFLSSSICLLLIFLFLSWRRQSFISRPSGVVITSSSASVLNEPVFGATELFVLHEGTVLEYLDHEPGWVKVQLPQGTSGFLREQQVGEF